MKENSLSARVFGWSANVCVMTCNCSASLKGSTEGIVDKNLRAS